MRVTSFKLLQANIGKRFYGTKQSIKPPENSIEPRNTTVDVREIRHLSKMSTEWWDLEGDLRGLHSFNHIRIPFVQDGLANTDLDFDEIKILDVGCGGGIQAEELARIYGDVTGIDPSEELIEVAVEHAALDSKLTGRLSYIHTTIEEHSESHADNYDVVITSGVLEHVANPQLFLKLCAAATKPGGSLFISTISQTVRAWLVELFAAEYIFGSIPRGTHHWSKLITPNKTQQLLEACDCETKLIRGMLFNPVNSQWSWISSTAYCYGLHAIKK